MSKSSIRAVELIRFDPKQVEKAIAQCEAEAKRLEVERQRVLLLATTYRQLLQLQRSPAPELKFSGPKQSAAATAEPQQALPLSVWLKGMTIAEAAFAVLSKENGKAMHGTAILKALEEGGRPVGGQQPSSSLQGTLANDERFEHTGEPNTWRLAQPKKVAR